MEGNHTNSSAATQAVKEGVQELMLVLNSSNVTDARLAAVFSRISDSLPLADVDLDLASQLINAISQLLNSSHNLSSHTKRMIIHLVDTLGLRLTFKEESANVTSPLLALAVVKVNTSNFKETSFGIGTGSNLQVSLGNETSQSNLGVVHLPSSLLSTLSAENQAQASRIQFNFYSNTLLFQDGQNGRKLNSHVISASVANLSISNLKDKINITLPNLKQSTVNERVHCAFWNFSKHGGNGSWDTGGCIAIQEQDNKTVCSCDHLTSFGVLVIISQPEHSPVHLLILTYITYVGCGLSSIFLAVTLVTYIAFEKIRKDYPSKILIHLCTALLLLNLFFLIDGWIYYFGPNACIAIAVLLHYFLLVSFTWMGLEAFHMYLALVKVFNTYMRKYILKFSLIGWGVPAVVVAIVVGINGGGNYGIVSYGRFPDNATDNFCWLKNDIAFYISVVGYFSLMALLNTSMFIVVLIQLCRIKKRNPSGENQRSLIQEIRSVSGLTVLLGITWGFAFFAWGPVNLAFMYLFAIFNTLQGLFIFIFHCAAKDTVRKQWRRYLCCGKLRLAENSDWSKTATSKKVPPVAAGGADTGSTNSLQSNSLSNCSSTLLMNKSYSDHSNGIVNFKRNKGSYDIENGGVYLDDIIVNKFAQDAEKDADYKKTSIAQRRTSQKRGSLPF
ncbi:adhesion G-protein coupled receptor G2 isoform X2 [Protopterus annectens]|nr:adhesion G-protein coupled receptor G2 isoform X2 [Protopterus annectens]